MNINQRGLTLIELLISLALSMSLVLVLIQLHLQSNRFSTQQQAVSRQLENIAALHHLLSHSVRDALYNVGVSVSDTEVGAEPQAYMFDNSCAGIRMHGQCIAPVMSWKAGENGAPDIKAAVSGSEILQVKQGCCTDVVADQFYLAHRGGVQTNPLSLYRRRLENNGNPRASVELIEGVIQLSFSFIIENHLMGGLALVDYTQVANWWQLKAVRVHVQLQDIYMEGPGRKASFTISGRKRHATSNVITNGIVTTDAIL